MTSQGQSPQPESARCMHAEMSKEEGRVATQLLKEAFGDIVGKVGGYLIRHGPCTLPDVLKGTDTDLELV